MGWSDTDAAPATIAGALAAFSAGLDGGARAADSVGPVLWYMLRDNTVRAVRDDGLGLRATTPTGADAGAKPVWGAFADAARRGGAIGLPPALGDAGGYTSPAAPDTGPAPATEPAAPVVPPTSTPGVVPAVLARPSHGSRAPVMTVGASGRRGRLVLRVRCVQASTTCSGAVRLQARLAISRHSRRAHTTRSRVTIVGGRTLRVRGGRSATLHVRLSRTGSAALRRHGRLRVQAVVSVRDAGGRASVTTRAATLRRQRGT